MLHVRQLCSLICNKPSSCLLLMLPVGPLPAFVIFNDKMTMVLSLMRNTMMLMVFICHLVMVTMMAISAVMVTMIFSGDGVYMPQQSETARPRACHSLCTAFTLLYTHRHTAHTACQPLHTATLHTAHCNYTLLHTVYMRTLHT